MKKFLCFLFFVAFITVLFAMSEESHSQCKIKLKDGRTIETETCGEEEEYIYYYKYGGKIQIDKNNILDFSNAPDAAAKPTISPEQIDDKISNSSTNITRRDFETYTVKRKRELKKEVEIVDKLNKQNLGRYDECKHIPELKKDCTISYYSGQIEVDRQYLNVWEDELRKHQDGINLYKSSKYMGRTYWENHRLYIEEKIKKYRGRLTYGERRLSTYQKRGY